MKAGEIIREARDEHPSFTEQAHPDGVLLRSLSTYERELMNKVAVLDRSRYATFQDIALPFPSFEAGVTVNEYVLPVAVEVYSAQPTPRWAKVQIVGWSGRLKFFRAAVLRGRNLSLTGRPEDWTPFSKLRFHYVAAPARLDSLDSVLTLDEDARRVLVSYLVHVMGWRSTGRTDLPGSLAADMTMRWQAQEANFLDVVARRANAQYSVMTEVV
ncbi:MAG: hypothetical protein ONB52_21870 [candidate division KSB1 bacterium]|nr:hypothetical protein [candidate division KSB1 bacterium]